MDWWETIVGLAASKGLRFLVIGGHAVAAHGYERTTHDADLLISREEADRWLAALLEAGYSQHHRGDNFIQCNPPPGKPWAIDLMLVNQETFARMLAEAQAMPCGQSQLKVVSLRHLLALKLFALKHQPSQRALKDMDDLLNLVQTNGVDVREPWFRELALKQAGLETYEKILHALG